MVLLVGNCRSVLLLPSVVILASISFHSLVFGFLLTVPVTSVMARKSSSLTQKSSFLIALFVSWSMSSTLNSKYSSAFFTTPDNRSLGSCLLSSVATSRRLTKAFSFAICSCSTLLASMTFVASSIFCLISCWIRFSSGNKNSSASSQSLLFLSGNSDGTTFS